MTLNIHILVCLVMTPYNMGRYINSKTGIRKFDFSGDSPDCICEHLIVESKDTQISSLYLNYWARIRMRFSFCYYFLVVFYLNISTGCARNYITFV